MRNQNDWMWAEACEVLSQAERLHRQCFVPGSARLHTSWEPPIDLIESGRQLLLVVALPGIELDNVRVTLRGDELSLTAIRRNVFALHSVPSATVHRLEIPYGKFSRHVRLPSGSYEVAESKSYHGCLHLLLNRRE